MNDRAKDSCNTALENETKNDEVERFLGIRRLTSQEKNNVAGGVKPILDTDHDDWGQHEHVHMVDHDTLGD